MLVKSPVKKQEDRSGRVNVTIEKMDIVEDVDVLVLKLRSAAC